MAEGIFQVKTLAVSLSEAELIVECGITAFVADCGQPTAKGFALRFGGESMSLGELKTMLTRALERVDAFEAHAELRSRARSEEKRSEG